jgi:hypothetical protein
MYKIIQVSIYKKLTASVAEHAAAITLISRRMADNKSEKTCIIKHSTKETGKGIR